MVNFIDDAVFLLEFSETATIRQGAVIKPIRILFDLEYVALDLGAEGRDITALCLTTDVLGTRHGNTLTVRTKDYTVVGVQPDGDGAYTKLILSEGTGTMPDPGHSSMIKYPFHFGDASPKPIYLVGAGTTIFTAQIVITTAFDGVGATLQLGDSNVSDRLIASYQVAPTEVGEYERNPAYLYAQPTQLLLTINPGVGGTQGTGFVLLQI